MTGKGEFAPIEEVMEDGCSLRAKWMITEAVGRRLRASDKPKITKITNH